VLFLRLLTPVLKLNIHEFQVTGFSILLPISVVPKEVLVQLLKHLIVIAIVLPLSMALCPRFFIDESFHVDYIHLYQRFYHF